MIEIALESGTAAASPAKDTKGPGAMPDLLIILSVGTTLVMILLIWTAVFGRRRHRRAAFMVLALLLRANHKP